MIMTMKMLTKTGHLARSKCMRSVYLIVVVLYGVGCGTVGQGTGGAVTPTRAIFIDIEAQSYDDLATVDDIIITIPSGTTKSRFKILFEQTEVGIDPASLTVNNIKEMYPNVTDGAYAADVNTRHLYSIGDVNIEFNNNGDREIILLTDRHPTFTINNSVRLRIPMKFDELKSYIGEPIKIVKP